MAGGPTRFERGAARLREVYAGDVVDLPEGTMAFNDVMVRTLFAEVWARDVLDLRSRRLLLMGVIATNGQVDTWKVQARASLRNGELTPDELKKEDARIDKEVAKAREKKDKAETQGKETGPRGDDMISAARILTR